MVGVPLSLSAVLIQRAALLCSEAAACWSAAELEEGSRSFDSTDVGGWTALSEAAVLFASRWARTRRKGRYGLPCNLTARSSSPERRAISTAIAGSGTVPLPCTACFRMVSRTPRSGLRGIVLLRRGDELLGTELAIDRAGRIVVVIRFNGLNRGGLLVRRLTTRGRLDLTFGHHGEQEVRFGTQSFLGSATVDREGRVYVAGDDFERRMLSVLRLTSRGSLDSGFGDGGIARLPNHAVLALPTAVAVQRDGRVLLAGVERFPGTTAPTPCGYCIFLTLGRLTLGGRPDRTFGEAGVVHTKLELTPSARVGLALQRDGRIVVASGIRSGRSSSFLLVRLLRTGAFDSSFGDHGFAVTDMHSAKRKDNEAMALAIAGDGRIVVAGRSARDELEGGGQRGRVQFRFAVARFLP